MADKYGNGRIIESMMQQQPQMIVANPINDVQLVGLMASRRTDLDPKDAVEWAEKILLEAARRSRTFYSQIVEAMKGP